MDYSDFRSIIHERVLFYRSLDRLIMTDKFQMAWKTATEFEREDIVKCVDNCKKYELVSKLKKLLKDDIGSMSIKDLRIMASTLGIRYYASLNKAGILSVLKGAGV